ncbi:MAG: peptide MFS transporter [Flavobacteriia bacterium]|nr:peptide MFS transporter [Flavobacteriia bacterium]
MEKNLSLEEIQSFKGKFPKQLWYLFFSEMWERFCFYGMRGMLTYFMVHHLMMSETVANLQYGATQAFVYAFTFVGGLFADKLLGFRKSLFWGGLLMITGSCILAVDPKEFFFIGISFTIIGTGFFKPNISTMVGSLYKSDDNRRDAGFSLFYSGINIGALLGGYACIYLGKNYSWNLAFGLAAIVMAISLITFVFTQNSLGPIGLTPTKKDKNGNEIEIKKTNQYLVYLGSLLVIPIIMTLVSKTEYTDYFMYLIGPATLIYLFYEMSKCNKEEKKKLFAALIFIVFSIIFWAFFEQSGGSLSLFAANNLNDKLLGVTADPNGVNNASNSLFVIIFAPILGIIWIAMSKKKIEPNTLIKFGLGFIFLAIAFYVFYATRFFADKNGVTSLDMFTLAYFIITFGELCLSPIGLSIMTKLSTKNLQGVMMGMWFLASAYGQYAAGILGAGMASTGEHATKSEKLITYTDGYYHLAIYALIAGIIIISLSPFIKKLMGNVK